MEFSLLIDAPKVDDSAAKVWKLSAMDMNDDDIDLVDDDELLDEEDLKKPDPASLRGTIKILSCLYSHVLKTHLNSTFIYSKTGVYRGISVHKFSYLCSFTSIVGTHWKGLRRLV